MRIPGLAVHGVTALAGHAAFFVIFSSRFCGSHRDDPGGVDIPGDLVAPRQVLLHRVAVQAESVHFRRVAHPDFQFDRIIGHIHDSDPKDPPDRAGRESLLRDDVMLPGPRIR